MSAMRSDLIPNVSVINIGSQAASIILPGMLFKSKSKIKSVSLINQTALAADNTNFLQVVLEDLSGNDLATVDTRAANQGALVAMTPKDAVLSAGGVITKDSHGELLVPAGAGVQINVIKNGTGVPTLAQIQIEWYPL
jgi:archaellum component FlaF (FlaF/FlaG flagellin family)